MGRSTVLSWNDRFAVIKRFQPSDKEITSAFGVTTDELITARELLSNGTFVVSKNIDVDRYGHLFTKKSPPVRKMPPIGFNSKKVDISGLAHNSIIRNKPETATRTIKKRKPGNKGSKIDLAFRAVPTDPVDVASFSEKYQVSIHVLRQGKRFDSLPGSVCVRKDKTSGVIQIWREPPTC